MQTEGATKEWPISAISAFEELIGSAINYIYIRDRDFFLDHQVQKIQSDVKTSSHKICFLEYRNRESYLLIPAIISSLTMKKWKKKNPGKKRPSQITEAGIKDFIIKIAEQDAEDAQASLLNFHDGYLKAQASEKQKRYKELLSFFRDQYARPIERAEVPCRLVDSKKVLRSLRKSIADSINLSFSDKEILESFSKRDIPKGLQQIIKDIYEMCKK